uniref:Uncharacterized protein n=1 Tax=Anguilla anguilla TaxID=7936 RepID=A0A0E9UHC6_ANGAN
MPVMLNGESY